MAMVTRPQGRGDPRPPAYVARSVLSLARSADRASRGPGLRPSDRAPAAVSSGVGLGSRAAEATDEVAEAPPTRPSHETKDSSDEREAMNMLGSDRGVRPDPGNAAMRGAVLIGLAVVIGIALLQVV